MVVAMDSLPEGLFDSLVARIYNCVSSVNSVLMIEEKAKCCVCQALRGIPIHASHVCLHCSDNLCDKCAKGHNSSSLTHAHMAVPVSDIRSGKVKKDAQRKYSCDIGGHGNQYFEFYCMRCSQPVCFMCLLAKHKGHDFELLDEAAKTRRKHITALAQSLQKWTSGVMARLLDRINVMETAPDAEHSFSDIDSVNTMSDMSRFLKAVPFLLSSVQAVDMATNNDILTFYSELNGCMEHIMNSKQIIKKCALHIESALRQSSESCVGTAGNKGARPKKVVITPDIHCEKDTTLKATALHEEASKASGYSFRLTKCLTVVGKHGYHCNNGSSYDYANDPNFSYSGSYNSTGVFADVFLPPDGWLDTSSSSNSDSALFLIECEHENNVVSDSQGHTPNHDTISSPEEATGSLATETSIHSCSSSHRSDASENGALGTQRDRTAGKEILTGSLATETSIHPCPSSHRSDASEKEALGTQRHRTTGKEVLTENEGMESSGSVPQGLLSHQATRTKDETHSHGHELRPYRSQYSKAEHSSRFENTRTKMEASVRQRWTLESTRKTELSSRIEDPGTKMPDSVRQNLESKRGSDMTMTEYLGNVLHSIYNWYVF